jgi:hypothetical protein
MVALNGDVAVVWSELDFNGSVDTTQQLRTCSDGIQLYNSECPPQRGSRGAGMRVRLTRKLAECIDGVDLSRHRVRDVIEVTRHEAELLFAEGWAEQVGRRRQIFRTVVRFRQAKAAERSRRRSLTAQRLRESRRNIDQQSLGPQERRRAEDRFREELHDSRAKTISKDTLGPGRDPDTGSIPIRSD